MLHCLANLIMILATTTYSQCCFTHFAIVKSCTKNTANFRDSIGVTYQSSEKAVYKVHVLSVVCTLGFRCSLLYICWIHTFTFCLCTFSYSSHPPTGFPWNTLIFWTNKNTFEDNTYCTYVIKKSHLLVFVVSFIHADYTIMS